METTWHLGKSAGLPRASSTRAVPGGSERTWSHTARPTPEGVAAGPALDTSLGADPSWKRQSSPLCAPSSPRPRHRGALRGYYQAASFRGSGAACTAQQRQRFLEECLVVWTRSPRTQAKADGSSAHDGPNRAPLCPSSQMNTCSHRGREAPTGFPRTRSPGRVQTPEGMHAPSP